MAGSGWKWLDMAENCWKRLEITGIAGNGCKGLGMAGH